MEVNKNIFQVAVTVTQLTVPYEGINADVVSNCCI